MHFSLGTAYIVSHGFWYAVILSSFTSKYLFLLLHYLFSFFSFWLHSGIWKFLGQVSDLSHSSNLCHSCATLDPLTHCTGPWGHWRECHSPCTRLRMPAHLFIEFLNIGQEGVKTGGLSSISLSFTGVERSRYSQTKKDSRWPSNVNMAITEPPGRYMVIA